MAKVTFLDLPAELRNRIYDLVLPTEHTLTIRHVFTMPDFTAKLCGVLEPTISAANTQIRSETLSVFYGKNTFYSFSVFRTLEYLTILGPQRVVMLRDLRPFELPVAELCKDRVIDRLKNLREEGSAATKALSKEAVSLAVADGSDKTWQKLMEIEDLEVVGDGGDWCVRWKENR